MEFFTLKPSSNTYKNGEAINGLKTKLWVERYRLPGEFTFTCKPTRAIRQQLPLGRLISHTDTYQICMVENHEIREDSEGEPVMTITGRSVDAFLENRYASDAGQGFSGDTREEPEPGWSPIYGGVAWPYIMAAQTPWGQAVKLIRDQIQSGYAVRDSFILPDVHVASSVPADTLEEVDIEWDEDDREVKRGNLHKTVIDLLDEFNGGIKVERPRIVGGTSRPDIWFIVHTGTNQKGTIQFTYEAGDLEDARYFWSNKRVKNAIYVSSRHYAYYHSISGITGWNRKVDHIDASDLNANPLDAGWGGFEVADKLEKAMRRRAQRSLGGRKTTLELIEATISKTNKYRYRKDYNLGDLVHVVGNYDVSQTMRVTEYTESEDEEGESGFPSLTKPNV